ncbi:MAG: ABC transporter permease [Chloroflexia bacterium]|nr:ABC transporter permease [Chloroflexia bacterium]
MDDLSLSYLFEHPGEIFDLAVEHLVLSVTVIVLGFGIALPLGLLATRFRRLTLPLLASLGALYTVPSLAFLAVLIPSLGLGRDNAIVVLVAYAQIFLVRNIVAGLRGVDSPTLEAARGIGMTPWQVFRQVRWPLALPIVMAGIRTALVTTISLATMAAAVDGGGLGELLFIGLSRMSAPQVGLPMVLAGAIAITALAILSDLVLRVAERQTTATRARRAAR